MSNLHAGLELAGDIIREICRLSGTPRASVRVMHAKEVVYMRGFGFRDVENKIAPDEDTIYYLASLSKSFTAAAAADLIEDGRVAWDTPVKDILPKFTHFDAKIKSETIIID
jgi:CubicO group peptidase (beta-lactamase class C family)